jgi:hypothetical protein
MLAPTLEFSGLAAVLKAEGLAVEVVEDDIWNYLLTVLNLTGGAN